jgi:hypothetical protein
VKSSVGLSKPPRVVSWKQPKTVRTLKEPLKKTADAVTIREIIDGGATPTYVLEPLAPSAVPGARGTALFVPDGQAYYFVLIYVGGEEGSVIISLPEVQGILVVDLPEGFLTPKKDINKAIADGTGGGPPGVVGPDSK